MTGLALFTSRVRPIVLRHEDIDANMLEVTCSGSPYEIGYHHGRECRDLVAGSLDFTRSLSTTKAKKSWTEIRILVGVFSDSIQQRWPRYHEEMRGLAEGAECDILDIVALNVRTEVAFGLATEGRDGCTNAWVMTSEGSLQGQNWDWLLPQKQNLVKLTILQDGLPDIKMITEAGMIGKIGLNSAGVGVTYNALYMKGTVTSGLPSHLAMRMALESRSVKDACRAVTAQNGMAASAYILVGDASTARGLEFSSKDIRFEWPNEKQYLVHTNHCTLNHAVAEADMGAPPADSVSRLSRIHELLQNFEGGYQAFSDIFKDEDGFPTSICRKYREGQSLGETLFSIVIDYGKRNAMIKLGRPTEPDEVVLLNFETSSAR